MALTGPMGEQEGEVRTLPDEQLRHSGHVSRAQQADNAAQPCGGGASLPTAGGGNAPGTVEKACPVFPMLPMSVSAALNGAWA